MKELLEKINETFNKSLVNSSDETQLQIKILKNNINALFMEYENKPLETLEVEEPVQTPDSLDQDDMKSILIVDDSSMIRNYLERIFINEYNVKMAVDGNEGIEKIKNDPKINIILLDLVMPNKDGMYVLDQLNKKGIEKNIIVQTSYNEPKVIRKVSEYGVNYYILKPYDLTNLEDRILDIFNSQNEKTINLYD